MVVLGCAEAFCDAGCQHGQAEEGSGRDGGGHEVIGIEGDGSDIAGAEAGEAAGIHFASCPDGEVAEDEEGGRGCQDSGSYTQQGGFSAEDLATDEADGGVPSPGNEIGAGVEGITVGEDGEVIVSRHKGEDGGEGMPAAATGAEEEQSSANRGEVHAGGVEDGGKDAAENSEQ